MILGQNEEGDKAKGGKRVVFLKPIVTKIERRL
jgi:hypothetical protein